MTANAYTDDLTVQEIRAMCHYTCVAQYLVVGWSCHINFAGLGSFLFSPSLLGGVERVVGLVPT